MHMRLSLCAQFRDEVSARTAFQAYNGFKLSPTDTLKLAYAKRRRESGPAGLSPSKQQEQQQWAGAAGSVKGRVASCKGEG